MRRTGLAVLVLLALAGLAMGVQAQGDDGLVAEWHFDEDSGNVFGDSSGNGNDGVIYEATWVDGKFGKALEFDGIDDYLRVSYSDCLYIHGDFSIEFWFYINDNHGIDMEIISNRGTPGCKSYSWVIMIRNNKFEYWVSERGTADYFYSNTILKTNTWYHAIFARDAGVGKIFLNGEFENSMPISDIAQMTTNDIAIGYDIQDNKYPFNGVIDEVRIYNRALTADEIKAHYELVGTTYRTPAATAPTPSVRIISAPSTIHGGEDVEVTVGWDNIPTDWKLIVSLEKSETDKDRLADDAESTISGTGEAVFKLSTYQIDETYDRALVWASLRDENYNWKGIYTDATTTVLPAATRAPKIAATPEPSPVRARTPALVNLTDMPKLAGGAIIALLAIVLLARKLRGKRRDVPEEPPAPEETKTTPPPEPTPRPAPPDPTPPPEPAIIPEPVPTPTPQTAPQPVPEPRPTRESAAIEVRRGYEVLPNNDIRFGIRVINPTPYLIADVETILGYDKTLLSLKGDRVQTLANIHPNGERTAKYVLTSRGCVHNEKIDATAIYRDHTGKRRTVQMRPKEVYCVCPFLKENPMRESEFAELAAKSEHIEEGLSFSGIDRGEIAAVIKESCRHRLHTVGEREIGNTIILNLAGESIGEKAYYLLTAAIQPYKEKDVTRIAFRAYSDKPHGLHGFLNEITASIRHLVGSVQSAKEIGIIEHKQVIKIINSGTGDIIMGDKQVKQVAGGDIVGGTKITGDVVATRSRIGGADNVIPNEGMVQRSEIGSRQRCPNCGNETQTNEKFCPNCGAAIEQGE